MPTTIRIPGQVFSGLSGMGLRPTNGDEKADTTPYDGRSFFVVRRLAIASSLRFFNGLAVPPALQGVCRFSRLSVSAPAIFSMMSSCKAASRRSVLQYPFTLMYRNICLLSSFILAPLCAQPVHLKVDTTQVVHPIDPRIYGQFLEHIYHSVNGGIWGEAVWNRSFEERLSPEDWHTRAGVLVTPPAADHESRFLIGAETWTDYDFFTDLRKTAGDGPITVGVRSTRAGAITLNFDKQLQLIHEARTGKTTLATADLPLDNDRWYRVHIRVGGHQVQAFIDDKPMLDAKIEAGAGQRSGVRRRPLGHRRIPRHSRRRTRPYRSCSIPCPPPPVTGKPWAPANYRSMPTSP